MSDEYVYHNSMQEQDTEFLFSNKQFLYVPDSNNGTYSNGQIMYDLASLSNSGKFIDFSQAFITVPLVMNLNLPASTATSVENAFACSLKNGFHNLVNSMSVEISNSQVVNLTNLSMLDINFRLLSTSSPADMANFLPSINFSPDTPESTQYLVGANPVGLGETNNRIQQTSFTSAGGYGTTGLNYNKGRLERMRNTSFDPVNGTQSVFTSQALCNTTGKNYYRTNNGFIDNTWYILATIPLKILHPIFSKLPLTKGMYMRLSLYLNTNCTSTITIAAGTNFTSVSTSSINNVFPCMISPIGAGAGSVYSAPVTSAVLSLGIGKSFNSQAYSHPTFQNCRLYCPSFDMCPSAEEQYLSVTPSKTIKYNDILTFTATNIPAGGQLSQMLTNGVSRPRYLLIVPQIASAVHGGTTATFGTTYTAGVQIGSPMNSPFSSAPGTTCPFSAVSNFNVLVSGTSVYQAPLQFGFENFLEEVRGCNSLNGGVPLGLSSGLIDQVSYENGYRFIFVDLSRRVSQSNDDISRSIQVNLTNSSPIAMDFFMTVSYERELQISTSTGALII